MPENIHALQSTATSRFYQDLYQYLTDPIDNDYRQTLCSKLPQSSLYLYLFRIYSEICKAIAR
ncbi:MAG: hypothetical protein LBU34_06335 [Planctomycetaceae bacterium]|nr:hypothetical protein [Planctomycetaceae bacterium]